RTKQSRRSNVEFPLLGGVRGGFALDVGHWMLNVQRSTFNAQRSTSTPLSSFSPLTGLLIDAAADVRRLNDVDVRARHSKEPTVGGHSHRFAVLYGDAATVVKLESERPERRGVKPVPDFPDVHCN